MSYRLRRIGAGWVVGVRARALVLMLAGLGLSACATTQYSHAPHRNHPVPEVTETALASPTLARLQIRGVDVSYYQGDIDWPTVRAEGVTFAYIKATEGGDYLDSKFHRNWLAAKAAGIRRGAYHFYYLCRPVTEQIAWFEQHVPRDADALPPAIDMEWVPTSKNCQIKPSRAKIIADLRLFLESLERHYGKRPVIYATGSFHHDILEGAFNDYPFWLRAIDGPPGERYAFRPWHFWQYSARGTIAGVNGHIDKNVFAGTHAEWANFVSGKTQSHLAATED
jgi:lysozyme